jgi:hypothetical protein
MTTAPAFQSSGRERSARAPRPSSRDVLMAQFRAIGFTLRLPMLIAAALAVLVTLTLAIQIASGDIEKHLLAEPSSLPGIIGALLPIAIWAREERFGPGFLWTLPVDRSRHALIKVLAGWLWLVAGLALYALCQLVLALVSDGGVLPVKMMYMLTSPMPASERLDPAMLRIVRWAPGPVVWVIPAAAATATYLLASAIMLGIRHPFRWVVGAVVLVPALSAATHLAGRLLDVEWLTDAPARAVSQLVEGRYGLEALLTLRTWSLDTRVVLTTGERIQAWSAIPNLGDWRIAALLWTTAGLLALWAAASRHREQRRA